MQHELDKDAWLRQQEHERHARIVVVNAPMALTPCLYFGTRRCTYSDVVSVVTTVRPIPRLASSNSSAYTPQKPQPTTSTVADATALHATTTTTTNKSNSNRNSTTTAVAWTEKALSTTRHHAHHKRTNDHTFVGNTSSSSSATATAYTTSPLAANRDRKQRLQMQQTLALTTESQFFMTRLHNARRLQFERELNAALVLQRVYRGFALRCKFCTMRAKLQLRKRIRGNLVKVTRGTAIIVGEKDRRARVLAVRTAAATRIQCSFRVWSAQRVAAKARVVQRFELRDRAALRLQQAWRAAAARSYMRKAGIRQREQCMRTLATAVWRLFQGHCARQRVRCIRMRQQLLAAQRLQWAAQRHFAYKANRQQRRRRSAEQQHAAAQQIQRHVRGAIARTYVLHLRVHEALTIRTACALAIQRVARGWLGRARMRFERAFDVHARAWRCAVHTTRLVRGFLARRAVQLERALQEFDLLVQVQRGNLSNVIDLLDGFNAIDDTPVDIAVENPHTRSNALHVASRYGHLDIVTHVVPKMLASATPQIVTAYTRAGATPLDLAIAHGHEQIATYLLAMTSSLMTMPSAVPTATVPVNSSNDTTAAIAAARERSLLLRTARSGMGALIPKLLLLFPLAFTGAERDSWTHTTALHEALLGLHTETFETPRATHDREDRVLATLTTILTKLPRASIDAQDAAGFTALHVAAQCGSLRAVRLLLEYGADVAVADANGRTAWRIALLLNHESCFLELRRKWLDSVTTTDATTNVDSETNVGVSDSSSRALVSAATQSHRATATAALHPQFEQALVTACRANDMARVQFFIDECGVSINTVDLSSAGERDSVLMLACRAANVQLVRLLIAHEHARGELLDVHYVNSNGASAFDLALSRSDCSNALVTLLVTKCARADASALVGTNKRSVCHEAVERGVDLRLWLNSNCGSVTPHLLATLCDTDNCSLLHSAAAFANVAAAKTLLNVGARVDQLTIRDRRTPLHVACAVGSTAIVQRMLQQQRDTADTAVDAVDVQGRTPFFDAVAANSIDCLELLLLHVTARQAPRTSTRAETSSNEEAILGSQVDARGYGLVHAAVSKSKSQIGESSANRVMVTYLIAHMPQHMCDQFPPQQLTPLHVASACGNAAAVAMLLAAMQDTDSDWRTHTQLRDAAGELPVHAAARYGHAAVLDAFAAAGIDCFAADAHTGECLLHFAVQCAMDWHHEPAVAAATVNALIMCGHAVAAVNSSGLQPLHIATRCTASDQDVAIAIARVLVHHGARVDAVSMASVRATPIELALQRGNTELAAYLQSVLDCGGVTTP